MANKPASQLEKADKLLTYLAKKIEESKPANTVHFIVDVLCTYYPTHVPYFSKIWFYDKELDAEKQNVRNFFKHNNSTSTIAQHFINAGFDCLESLTYLTTDILEEIQAYNNVQWLPGHKVRVHQIFQNITQLVKDYSDFLKTQKRTKLQYITRTIPEHGITRCEYPVSVKTGTSHIAASYYYQKPIFEDLTSPDAGFPGQPKLREAYSLAQIANLSAEAATDKALDAINAKILDQTCHKNHFSVKES
ncbi:conserved hypothetical protein [Theileria equi strain WA]|uniref:Uncharacterized protein n=1 Tax=Theileria equi strain WA TaxID=1537102 RepID=L1LCS9_THEEQ|nr:conserved hypothetical protein [Theileria equi strain WA]EKX72973.1 conserved hypothetical protein [Theileria equi strain WA]|eukprot:XP_004832425.1 conserved hypothetical protein [Theileria equi strain WA]